MNLIEDLRKRLLRLKNKLVEENTEIKENIDTVNHILDIKEASDELKQKLILLHSLHKAEKQALEAYYAKMILEIVSINDLMLVELQNMKNTIKDNENKKIRSFKKLLIMYFIGGSTFIILWLLFHLDKEATIKVMDQIVRIISHIY